MVNSISSGRGGISLDHINTHSTKGTGSTKQSTQTEQELVETNDSATQVRKSTTTKPLLTGPTRPSVRELLRHQKKTKSFFGDPNNHLHWDNSDENHETVSTPTVLHHEENKENHDPSAKNKKSGWSSTLNVLGERIRNRNAGKPVVEYKKIGNKIHPKNYDQLNVHVPNKDDKLDVHVPDGDKAREKKTRIERLYQFFWALLDKKQIMVMDLLQSMIKQMDIRANIPQVQV
jgi:hypothetical protein